jgi:hypothetical protein
VDTVDLVDDVAQQVAADHAVLHALEDVGDHLALAAFFAFAGQAAQIGEQTLAATAIGTHCLFLVDEGQQFVAGDAILPGCPVAPAVRCFNDGLVGLAVEFGFFFVDGFEVVEELEEHHPGEQWQAIHVAIEALVLAQDLACGADQADRLSRVVSGALALLRRGFFSGATGLAVMAIREFSLLVNGCLQPRDGFFQALHTAEMAVAISEGTAEAVEGLHLHQLGQHVELDDAALDVLVE